MNDAKEMWNKIDMLLGKTRDPAPEDLSADEFNEYFSNIGSKVASENSSSNNTDDPSGHAWKNPPCIYEFKLEAVNASTIAKILKSFGADSSNDVLDMDLKLLSLSHEVIAPVLASVVNQSIYLGNVPDDWKFSRVTPVYKGKGSRSDKNNYRPISVISHVAKLVEKVIQRQLVQYLLEHDLVSLDQSANQARLLLRQPYIDALILGLTISVTT